MNRGFEDQYIEFVRDIKSPKDPLRPRMNLVGPAVTKKTLRITFVPDRQCRSRHQDGGPQRAPIALH